MSAATRATRRRVDALFARLVVKLGPAARGWSLDLASCYGGYVIVSDAGAGRPLGSQRRRGGEMCEALGFALDVLWLPAVSDQLGDVDAVCSCVEGGGR